MVHMFIPHETKEDPIENPWIWGSSESTRRAQSKQRQLGVSHDHSFGRPFGEAPEASKSTAHSFPLRDWIPRSLVSELSYHTSKETTLLDTPL
jgi:hypothetical protein